MHFRPAYQAHSSRKYTYPDVLTCPPARIQGRNLDPRNRKIGDRSYAGIENACLQEAEDIIETVCSSSGNDVMQRDFLMRIDLPADHEVSLSGNDLPKQTKLTIGRNTTKQIMCVAMKIL